MDMSVLATISFTVIPAVGMIALLAVTMKKQE